MTIILRNVSDDLFPDAEMLLYSLYTEGDLSEARLDGENHCALQGPIPVYSIAQTDEAMSDWTENSEFSCWRFIFQIDRTPTSILDVSYPQTDDETHNGLMLTQIETGPIVGAFRNALLAAEDNFHHREEEYELRILDIPFAHEQALWLQGAHSIFMPFQRDPQKTRSLSALEFFESLKVSNMTPN